MLKMATLEQWQLLSTLSRGGCEIDWADLTEPIWIGLERPSFGAELILTPHRLIVWLRVRIVARIPVVIASWDLDADWIKSLEWLSRCAKHPYQYCLHDWAYTPVQFGGGTVVNEYLSKVLTLQRGAHASVTLLATVSSSQQDEHDREITISVTDVMNNRFSKTVKVTYRNCTNGLTVPSEGQGAHKKVRDLGSSVDFA
jgi:hypothetical protein